MQRRKDHIITQLCCHEQRKRSKKLYNYISPPNKAVMLGAPESGKTALLHSARHHEFLEHYQATVGAQSIPILLKFKRNN